mgnify:FL=1
MYESELIPLFEKCGTIWDLRLMMDPMTGLNRGYAFVTFTTRDAAQEAVRQVEKIIFLQRKWLNRTTFFSSFKINENLVINHLLILPHY